MPIHRWIASAAGGTSQRLNPGPAMIRSRSKKPPFKVEVRTAASSAMMSPPWLHVIILAARGEHAPDGPARASSKKSDRVGRANCVVISSAGAGPGADVWPGRLRLRAGVIIVGDGEHQGPFATLLVPWATQLCSAVNCGSK